MPTKTLGLGPRPPVWQPGLPRQSADPNSASDGNLSLNSRLKNREKKFCRLEIKMWKNGPWLLAPVGNDGFSGTKRGVRRVVGSAFYRVRHISGAAAGDQAKKKQDESR